MNKSFVTFMAFVVTTTTIFSFSSAASKASEEAGDLLFKNYAKNCIGKDGITQQDVDKLLADQFGSGEEPACLVTCLAEQFGTISGGKVQPEIVAAIARAAIEDKSKADDINRIAKECGSVTTDDKCQLGVKLVECLFDGAAKAGMDVEGFLSAF